MKNAFAYIYSYLTLFSQLVKNGMVLTYDKLRFSLKSICNAVCEECLQISIYIYPLILAIGENRHVIENDKLRF